MRRKILRRHPGSLPLHPRPHEHSHILLHKPVATLPRLISCRHAHCSSALKRPFGLLQQLFGITGLHHPMHLPPVAIPKK